MEKLIQKICSDVIKQHKQDKNVLGIMLFGSAVRSKFDQYSDIDIYILLKKNGEFSRINFIKNGIRVDIILNTIRDIKSYFREEKNSLRRTTSHMLAYGKIIFQRNGELRKIQDVARNNLLSKTKYKSGEVLMHKYSIDDFWGEVQRDIQNRDYVAFGLDSHFLVSNIIELFLKLNGEFLIQPNEMRKKLNRLDGKFSKLIEEFYKSENIKNKKIVLLELTKYIYKKSKGSLPKRWTIKNG